MLSVSDDNQSEVIEAFNSTSRYLDDLLNIDNNFYGSIFTLQNFSQIRPMCQIPRSHFWIYIYLYRVGFFKDISQLIRFARVPGHVDDFSTRNKDLTTTRI